MYYLIGNSLGKTESLQAVPSYKLPESSEDSNYICRILTNTKLPRTIFSTGVRPQALPTNAHGFSLRLLSLGSTECYSTEKGLSLHLRNLSGSFITNLGSDILLLLHVAYSHFTPASENSVPVNNIFQEKIRNRLQSTCKQHPSTTTTVPPTDTQVSGYP